VLLKPEILFLVWAVTGGVSADLNWRHHYDFRGQKNQDENRADMRRQQTTKLMTIFAVCSA
jgi:hypothetical protein